MPVTSQERVRLALEHKEADRVAIQDGPWGTTVARWHKEGLPEKVGPHEFFHYEFASTGPDISLRLPTEKIEETDEYIVQRGANGSAAIYLNSPNETNLRLALDEALRRYDVKIEGGQKLRYIHRVKDGTDVYFFANIGDKAANASVRLRGKIKPESWDPHTGKFSVPEYSRVVEDSQPVTRVKLALNPVHSLFIVGSR